jgi:hypothetical protein
VALLNSVRLSGHEGEFVVLDCGLTARQRERLATHCRVEQARRETGHWGYPLKPVAWRPEPSASVVVMIDSDIIVTGSLDPLLQDAAQGKIAMFVDLMAVLEGEPSRAFPEWQEVLELTSPLRRQPYLNSGLIAFSVPTWPGLVNRWAKACHLAARAAEQEEHRRLVWSEDPFGFPEQDSLNAILMSEVPPEALALYDYELAPITQRESVRIEDAPRLRCVNLGRETLLLHNTARPKAWERRAWVVQPYRAFADLLRRVLLSPDVRLRLEPTEVPLLLRPGLSGAALRVGARSLRGLVRLASRVLPPTARSGLSSRVRGWSIRSTRGV